MKSGIMQPLGRPTEVELAEKTLCQEFALRDIVGQSVAIRDQIAKARRYGRCLAFRFSPRLKIPAKPERGREAPFLVSAP
jgi:hypothetical protein